MSEPQPRTESPEQGSRESPRSALSLQAILTIAVLVVIVALLLANTRTVEVSWVFGSSRQPLVWIVLVTAILGWLLGIFTSMLFRHRRARKG